MDAASGDWPAASQASSAAASPGVVVSEPAKIPAAKSPGKFHRRAQRIVAATALTPAASAKMARRLP